MKEIIRDNLNYFMEHHAEVYDAYVNYGRLVHADGPLDPKTIALLKVVMSSVAEHNYALTTHLRKGLAAGLTREEMEHAILLTAPSVGFPNMMESLLILRDLLDD